MDARQGWMDGPHTPERPAASEVWAGPSESPVGGRGGDRAARTSWKRRRDSRWVPSLFPLLHGLLMPGGLVSVHQAEKQEADPSWRRETECLPGPQWTDWKTRSSRGTCSLLCMIKSLKKIHSQS